jgi:hypothetical protein
MHEKFALEHEIKIFKMLGRNIYGCCDPLHHKVDICIKNIPRLRKISMSPWIDFDEAVKNVSDKLVFVLQANPALLSSPVWDPKSVWEDLGEKLEKAKDCIVEIHLKDISTVRHEPKRLWEWTDIAKKITQKYAL